MENILNRIGEETLPSIIEYPFSKNTITAINIFYKPVLFTQGKEWSARASVKFTKGNTSGEQSFEKPTFDEVVIKIRNFINSLK